jgi:1,4-alpha-glucan branching enzyme
MRRSFLQSATPLVFLSIVISFSSCRQTTVKKPEAEKVIASVPPVSDVVMYELFIRNFSNEGTVNAIIPRLDEIKDLGVNTIWLMPIQPIGKENKKGTYGSPYAISDYYGLISEPKQTLKHW